MHPKVQKSPDLKTNIVKYIAVSIFNQSLHSVSVPSQIYLTNKDMVKERKML